MTVICLRLGAESSFGQCHERSALPDCAIFRIPTRAPSSKETISIFIILSLCFVPVIVVSLSSLPESRRRFTRMTAM